ncbi:hypothetical protein ACFO9Q_22320 [Paenibacillus sp. GCM10023252]|uniref:hypothetical protein n=1 Tax=Paenibacillus sp. GCM10023252 TaxID=3252649 RepID=UPI0036119573
MTDLKKPWRAVQLWKGIGLVALGHMAILLISILFEFIPILFLGLVQIVYVLPLAAVFHKDPAMQQGIFLAAGLTFLLNAACFGIVLANFS